MQQGGIFRRAFAEPRGRGRAAERPGRLNALVLVVLVWICPCPPRVLGGTGLCVCSAVSYFSTRVGSIIGAGRLSFRVRDGSGRFPVAVAAVTFFKLCWWWGAVVCAAGLWLRVCKFSAG